MHVFRLSRILLKNLQNVDDICDTHVPYTVKSMADVHMTQTTNDVMQVYIVAKINSSCYSYKNVQ
jgi:hypothetical protein